MLPNFLVEWKLHPLACVLIEAFKVPAVNIHSITISASQTQVGLDLAGDILALDYPSGFLFPISEVIIDISPQDVIIAVEIRVLLFDLGVLADFDSFIGEEEDGGVSDGQAIFDLDGGQKLQQRTAIVHIGYWFILLIILLFSGYFARHTIKFLGNHLRPLHTIKLNLGIGIFLDW